jgi:hypothetical protein
VLVHDTTLGADAATLLGELAVLLGACQVR